MLSEKARGLDTIASIFTLCHAEKFSYPNDCNIFDRHDWIQDDYNHVWRLIYLLSVDGEDWSVIKLVKGMLFRGNKIQEEGSIAKVERNGCTII